MIAIYARYSSDRQSERSIEGQVALCREWCAREGHEAATVFADFAISAASLDRPEMARLRETVRAGTLTLLVVESLDRLSRREADMHALLDDLAFAGVRVVGVTDGTDTAREGSEILIGVRSTMNAAYLRELGKKTRRGMRARVVAGMAACAVPFGYRTIDGADGRAIEIDEASAAIVRRIFAEHVAGKSTATIARALNEAGIAPPRSSRRDRGCAPLWASSSVRAMLSNETYCGVWIWNRREWRKRPGTQRRVARERPRAEWLRSERPHLAIVDRATWDAANAKAAPLAERQGAGRRSYLLSGLLRCGACGALMAIHGKTYYRCSRASATGACANRLSVREERVREAFLVALRSELLAEDAMADLLETIAEVLHEENHGSTDERALRLSKLSRVETKIARLVDALADGASPALSARLRELEVEARTERAALASLAALPSAASLPTVAEALDAVRNLDAMLTPPADVALGRAALRACLDGGSIKATPKRGTYVLEAGVMPPMLLGGSELRIAGAGFARIRTRVRAA